MAGKPSRPPTDLQPEARRTLGCRCGRVLACMSTWSTAPTSGARRWVRLCGSPESRPSATAADRSGPSHTAANRGFVPRVCALRRGADRCTPSTLAHVSDSRQQIAGRTTSRVELAHADPRVAVAANPKRGDSGPVRSTAGRTTGSRAPRSQRDASVSGHQTGADVAHRVTTVDATSLWDLEASESPAT